MSVSNPSLGWGLLMSELLGHHASHFWALHCLSPLLRSHVSLLQFDFFLTVLCLHFWSIIQTLWQKSVFLGFSNPNSTEHGFRSLCCWCHSQNDTPLVKVAQNFGEWLGLSSAVCLTDLLLQPLSFGVRVRMAWYPSSHLHCFSARWSWSLLGPYPQPPSGPRRIQFLP